MPFSYFVCPRSCLSLFAAAVTLTSGAIGIGQEVSRPERVENTGTAGPNFGLKCYREPEADLNIAPWAAVSASSSQNLDGRRLDPAALVDRRFGTESVWSAHPAQSGRRWVQFEFPAPQVLRAARVYWLPGRWGMGPRFPAFRVLADRGDNDWSEIFASPSGDGSSCVNDTIYAGRTVKFAAVTLARLRIETLHDGAPLALREVELFDQVPPFRTREQEPGDTRIRLRERQEPAAAVRQGAAVLWATGSMEKVFRDDRLGDLSVATAGPVRLQVAQGETEAFQVVWWSPQGAREVRVSIDELRGPTPDAARWVTVNPVAYVYCRVASADLRLSVQGAERFAGPGFFPEVLRRNGPVAVLPGKHQPFWISVAVPREAQPGTYTGRVSVRGDGATLALPFEVRVWNFALPAPADFAMRNVLTFGGYDEKSRSALCPDEASARAYWHNIRRAAANMPGACFSSLEPAPVARDARDGLVYDWTPFDRQVEWCRTELGIRHFTLPFDYLAYHADLFAPAQVIGPGVVPGSERWFALLEQALGHYVGHLQARGWLKEFSFFIYDEPDNAILPACRRLVKLARRVDPALHLILHSHPWTPEMIALDATAVLNPRHYHAPFVRRLLARGWSVWTYCNGASLIDGPPTAGRVIPWIYFKQGMTGMTWHSLDDWAVTSPWEAPDRYLSWNASSCFLFPDPDAPLEALHTIRWEQWRDGMEDFELLRMLRDSARNTRDEAMRRAAAALLARAAAVGETYGYEEALDDEQVFAATWRPRATLPAETRAFLAQIKPRIKYDDNPDIIEALRREIGGLIEEMQR